MLVAAVFALALALARGADILCVFPTPAHSHQSVFAAYVDKLVGAGHNVTVITPMPRRAPGLTEVVTAEAVGEFGRLVARAAPARRRGAVADQSTVTAANYQGLVDLVALQMASDNVTALLANRDNTFDLVVCEAYLSYLLVFGHLFRAPVIQISSGYGLPENFETMGAGCRDPVRHPSVWRSSFGGGRARQLEVESVLRNEWGLVERAQEHAMAARHGPGVPPLVALKRRVALLFVNVPPLMDNDRPVPPTVVYLGGLHLVRPRPIRDRQLIRHLNRGPAAVYASFGSGISVEDLDPRLVAELVRAFGATPHAVLWKADPSLRDRYNISDNVLLRSWFPQRDLLNHPKIAAFVTQGGVQSTDEAIDSGVPLIGLPMMGDQFYNLRRYAALGAGVVLDVLRLEQERLEDKIRLVIGDRSYAKRARRLGRLFRDAPLKPLHRALWHTNYVIRNGLSSERHVGSGTNSVFSTCIQQ